MGIFERIVDKKRESVVAHGDSCSLMCLLVKKVVVLFFYKYFGASSANNKNAFFFFIFLFLFLSGYLFSFFISVLIRKLLDSYLIRLVSFNKHFIFYLREHIIFDALVDFVYFKL